MPYQCLRIGHFPAREDKGLAVMTGRFVILTHDYPFLHWDLMLENPADLRTWRLLTEPGATSGPIPAESLPRHRKAYLDYEGPVSGDRGCVTRWDAGEYELLSGTGDVLRLRLAGMKLNGIYTLSISTNTSPEWTFCPCDV